MSQPQIGEVPFLPSDRRGGCGGGCLRSVIGFPILIAVIVTAALLHDRIVARLQAPDYTTGILAVSGGYALDFLIGFALIGFMSVIAFTTTKQRGAGVFTGLLALGCLAIALSIGSQTWLDLLSTPATVRGIVTRHTTHTPKGSVTYYLELAGSRYSATQSVYQQTVDGQCAILTYGPHTHVATTTAPCSP